MMKNSRHATRSGEQGDPVPHRQGIGMINLQALPIYQGNGERAKRHPVLERANRTVEGISIH